MQGHKNREKEYIIHTSRTIRHRKIRIKISITASHEDHNIWVQDLTKAYIKGYDLELGEYIKPAEQFKIAARLHKKNKPLYGLSESENPGSKNT